MLRLLWEWLGPGTNHIHSKFLPFDCGILGLKTKLELPAHLWQLTTGRGERGGWSIEGREEGICSNQGLKKQAQWQACKLSTLKTEAGDYFKS